MVECSAPFLVRTGQLESCITNKWFQSKMRRNNSLSVTTECCDNLLAVCSNSSICPCVHCACFVTPLVTPDNTYGGYGRLRLPNMWCHPFYLTKDHWICMWSERRHLWESLTKRGAGYKALGVFSFPVVEDFRGDETLIMTQINPLTEVKHNSFQ